MMIRFRFAAGLLLLSLLLAACQAAATPGGDSPAATVYPAGEQNAAAPTGYPQQSVDGPDLSGAYPVLPGDENKAAGNFFAENFELRANPSDPAKVDLFAAGTLPTPCNAVRAFVNPPDQNQQIHVQVYSVAERDAVCAQVLEPFEGVVTTFTGIPAGQYQVYANNQLVGEMVVP